MSTINSEFGRFRCRRCGDRFDLSDKEEMKMFEEGYYDHEPDTCDDCCDMRYAGHGDYPEYSDADPGL